jgi:DNA-binding PadR family transcriptional regulator
MPDKHKKYAKTPKGKKALRRARKKYDLKDPERRRRQKREYMRRWRQKQKEITLKEIDEK